jgi:hypothetical protein
MSTSPKYIKIMEILDRATRTDDHSQIDKIPSQDLKNAKYQLARNKNMPWYQLLLDKIEEREKMATSPKNREIQLFKDWIPFALNKKVFLAHRFIEEELVKQIKDKLTENGFTPIEGKVEHLGYITDDILQKIQTSGFFLALITPLKEFKEGTFSTSSWILMEIGVAIAYGRIPLVLAENCVDQEEYAKKMRSDCQYEIFNREKDFETKLEVAIKRIKKEWEKHK